MSKPNAKYQAILERKEARRQLLQMLYQAQFHHCDLAEFPEYRLDVRNLPEEERGSARIDYFYFNEAIQTILSRKDEIEERLQPFVKRSFHSLDPIERAILWIAGYELLARQDIDTRVILNEAIELAKQYGADDSYKFINGVLDRASKSALKRLVVVMEALPDEVLQADETALSEPQSDNTEAHNE